MGNLLFAQRKLKSIENVEFWHSDSQHSVNTHLCISSHFTGAGVFQRESGESATCDEARELTYLFTFRLRFSSLFPRLPVTVAWQPTLRETTEWAIVLLYSPDELQNSPSKTAVQVVDVSSAF